MDSSHGSFETLRRALALKRHEQPPPVYFDYLHAQVLDRLAFDEDVEPEDWFAALFERFRLRPALVGVFSFALGAFYLAGLGYSGRLAPGPSQAQSHFHRTGGVERRLPPAGAPWLTTVAGSETRAPSVTPVIEAGPSASVLPLVRSWGTGSVSPVGYVVPLP